MIKTLSWQPFQAFGMTVEETRNKLLWAMEQYGKVCGLKIVSAKAGQKANIKVSGKATNDYAGYAKGSNIWISTIRNMSAREGFILGGVMMHEIGHTIGLKHTPQTDAYRHYIMHPWGPSDDWWSPSEIKSLQALYGEPVDRFLIHEIVYLGNLLRTNTKKLERLFIERDNLWKNYNQTGGASVLNTLNKKIEEIRKVQNHSKSIKAQRLQKITLWKNSVVPKSIVPLVKVSEPISQQVFYTNYTSNNLLMCGCDLGPLLEENWSVEDDLLQEPVL
jgi:hypothetical protein